MRYCPSQDWDRYCDQQEKEEAEQVAFARKEKNRTEGRRRRRAGREDRGSALLRKPARGGVLSERTCDCPECKLIRLEAENLDLQEKVERLKLNLTAREHERDQANTLRAEMARRLLLLVSSDNMLGCLEEERDEIRARAEREKDRLRAEIDALWPIVDAAAPLRYGDGKRDLDEIVADILEALGDAVEWIAAREDERRGP